MTQVMEEPAQERAVKTARNAVFNVVAFLYPALLAIVLTPLFLHYIGDTAYGVYALSVAFVSILGVLEFGAGIALMRYLPEHLANQDDEAASDVMRAGVAFYGLLALAGALISAVIALFFVDSLFHVSPGLKSAAQRAFLLGGLAFSLTVLMNVFGSVLGSLQRFDITTKITLAATTVTTAVSVVLVVLGAGLDGVMVGVVLQPALGLIFFARAVRKKLPGLRFTPRWNATIVGRLASLSSYVFIGNISGLVLFQFDKFYLGVVSGLVVVTFYVVPGALASRLHAVAGSITSIALPAASDLFSRGDLRRVHILYRRATWLTGLLLTSVATPAVLFAPKILQHWLGSTFAAKSTDVLQILIATYFVLGFSAIPYWLTMAAGRPRSSGVFNLGTAAINVGAIFLLVPPYGLVGAAFAYLVSMVTVPAFVWYVERRVLNVTHSPWPGIGARLAVGVAAQAAACLLLRPYADNLIATIVLVLLCIVVGPATLYGLGLIETDDKALLGRVFGRGQPDGAAS